MKENSIVNVDRIKIMCWMPLFFTKKKSHGVASSSAGSVFCPLHRSPLALVCFALFIGRL